MAFYLYSDIFTMYFMFVGSKEAAERGWRHLGLLPGVGKMFCDRPLGPLGSLGAFLSCNCEDNAYPRYCYPPEDHHGLLTLPDD